MSNSKNTDKKYLTVLLLSYMNTNNGVLSMCILPFLTYKGKQFNVSQAIIMNEFILICYQ